MADASYSANDWPAAIELYGRLVEEDPYNELAHQRYAHSSARFTMEQIARLEKQAASDRSSASQKRAIKKEVAKLLQDCIEVQNGSLKFPRSRREPLRELILLHCLAKDKDAAMDAFLRYREEPMGYKVRPLYSDANLRLLWDDESFREYAARERSQRLPGYRW